jgi:hypothetical protein
VRSAFEHAGFDADQPIYWQSSGLTTFFVRDNGFDERIALVLVYPDQETAAEEHRAAHAQEEQERGMALALSDDVGPQLLPGYGRSAWWHNVAVMQALRVASADDDAEAISTAATRRSELARLTLVDVDLLQTLRSTVAQEQRF